MDTRGGFHNFPSIFCLTVQKVFVHEPFYVSKIFWHRKNLWIRGGGGREYHDFPSKNVRLIVRKNFVGEPICVSENFWYRKISRNRGEGAPITIFRRNFLSRNTEKFRKGTFRCFKNFLKPKNFMDKRGGSTIFCRFFCLTIRNFS